MQSSCDPMKQLLVENRSNEPFTVVVEPVADASGDTLVLQVGPGQERNILYGFGAWDRPSDMRDSTGRMVGAAFESDRDVTTVQCDHSIGTLKVKRRYLLGNGLVVRVK
ncbi:MAG: hypothetical protein JNL05_08255 [Flavobacteriales bacterium]|nr:hypothetical protein [Flavobacteriales bacterium]